ncbi:MAG: preprotein translocase subunit SecG [Candidatus Melainabacteria bacterium]|nr:preprotein translocase subunit SecG [Candidatus Melainabacteria bacterium]
MELLRMLLLAVQMMSALLLIVLVLLHSPKGDGIGGIGGAAQLFASQKGAESTLNQITTYTAGVFYVVSFILGYYLGQL